MIYLVRTPKVNGGLKYGGIAEKLQIYNENKNSISFLYSYTFK